MSESACDGLEQLTRRSQESEALYREVIEDLEMRQMHSRPDRAAPPWGPTGSERVRDRRDHQGATGELRLRVVTRVLLAPPLYSGS